MTLKVLRWTWTYKFSSLSTYSGQMLNVEWRITNHILWLVVFHFFFFFFLPTELWLIWCSAQKLLILELWQYTKCDWLLWQQQRLRLRCSISFKQNHHLKLTVSLPKLPTPVLSLPRTKVFFCKSKCKSSWNQELAICIEIMNA